tara:strand:+ start:2584 stop:2826 length:243 start_codon:yes stop_codon:yes gene_type:complete
VGKPAVVTFGCVGGVSGPTLSQSLVFANTGLAELDIAPLTSVRRSGATGCTENGNLVAVAVLAVNFGHEGLYSACSSNNG